MKRVWKSMDYSLLLPLVILCVLGVIMVYSSSSIVAISSRYNWPADYFLKTIIGPCYWDGNTSDCRYNSLQILEERNGSSCDGARSLVLLAAAYLFGKEINGAKGWILGIQPAEFAKIAVIITLASFC